MTAWETRESIIQEPFIRLLADCRRDQIQPIQHIRIPTNGVFGLIRIIRIAAAQEIRSGFSKEIFHALGQEEADGKR